MMLSAIEEFIIFGFVPLMIGIFAVPEPLRVTEATLSGTMATQEHSLSDNGFAIVELVEQQHGETAPCVLARETIRWSGGEKQKFAVRFDPSLIEPTACYALRARVIIDGTARFETAHPHPTAPLSGDGLVLALAPVASNEASGSKQPETDC